MRVGIETTIYLQALDSKNRAETLEDFAKLLADRYNADVPRRNPGALGMRPTMRADEVRGCYDRWSLVRKRISTSSIVPGCK